MLTQVTPSLVQALQSHLPDAAIKQLAQVLGNCNQPLTHRGGINVQPSGPLNTNGVVRPGGWNPADYGNLLPNAGSVNSTQVDIGGWSGGSWNSNNYYGDQFFFPTSQEFSSNNYYGGPNAYYGGESFFDQSTHNGITVQNLNATTINNLPVPGAPGVAGPAGAPGQPGIDGAWVDVSVFPLPGGGPVAFQRIGYLSGINPRVRTKKRSVRAVTGATFNAETCEIQLAFADIDYVDTAELAGVIPQTRRVLVPAGG